MGEPSVKIMQGLRAFPNAPVAKYLNSHYDHRKQTILLSHMLGLPFYTARFSPDHFSIEFTGFFKGGGEQKGQFGPPPPKVGLVE